MIKALPDIPEDSLSNEASSERLRSEIGRLVHGDFHAVHGWDTPLVNKLIAIFAHHNKEYAKQLLQRVEDEVIGLDDTKNHDIQARILNGVKSKQRAALGRIRTSIEKGD